MQSLWRLEAETAISNKCLLRMTLFVTPGATTGEIDQPLPPKMRSYPLSRILWRHSTLPSNPPPSYRLFLHLIHNKRDSTLHNHRQRTESFRLQDVFLNPPRNSAHLCRAHLCPASPKADTFNAELFRTMEKEDVRKVFTCSRIICP